MARIVFTKDKIEELKELYINGKSRSELAKYFNVSVTTIFRKLIENGLIENTKTFSENEKRNIVTEYNKTKNISLTAKLFNVQTQNIIPILKECHVQLSDVSSARRKYKVNEHYFDIIDTANKAYCLGIWYADGCVSNTNNGIYLNLQDTDKALLEQINKELNNAKPLKYVEKSKENSNWKDIYGIVIYSKIMKEALIKNGVLPRKSLIIQYPTFLSNELQNHFIRGIYDGDGSIFTLKNGNTVISIVGTRMICEGIRDVVENIIGIHGYVYNCSCDNNVTCVFRLYAKSDIINFLDWLYTDATIYMERKYLKYIQFKQNMNNSIAI